MRLVFVLRYRCTWYQLCCNCVHKMFRKCYHPLQSTVNQKHHSSWISIIIFIPGPPHHPKLTRGLKLSSPIHQLPFLIDYFSLWIELKNHFETFIGQLLLNHIEGALIQVRTSLWTPHCKQLIEKLIVNLDHLTNLSFVSTSSKLVLSIEV